MFLLFLEKECPAELPVDSHVSIIDKKNIYFPGSQNKKVYNHVGHH